MNLSGAYARIEPDSFLILSSVPFKCNRHDSSCRCDHWRKPAQVG